MLNSYKDLRRWFPAVEPPDAAAPHGRTDPDLEQALSQGCAGRFPHYIQDTEPEPFDFPFAGEPATRRAEFVGGWSDWVSGDRAPGPGDDYPARDADLVQFPWDEDAEPGGDDRAEHEPARGSGRSHRGRTRVHIAPDDEVDDAAGAREREAPRGSSRARDGRTAARRRNVASDDEVEEAAEARDREAVGGSGRAEVEEGAEAVGGSGRAELGNAAEARDREAESPRGSSSTGDGRAAARPADIAPDAAAAAHDAAAGRGGSNLAKTGDGSTSAEAGMRPARSDVDASGAGMARPESDVEKSGADGLGMDRGRVGENADRDADRRDEPAAQALRSGHFGKRGKRSGGDTSPQDVHTAWLDENDDWPGMDDDWLADDGEWSSGARPADAGRRGRLRIARARRDTDDSPGRSGGPGAAVSPHAQRDTARGRRESRPRAESSRTLREQTRPGRLRTAVVLVVAILLLAAAGAFALYLLHHHDRAGHAAFAARPEASPVRLTGATTGTTLVCPTERSGSALRGAGPGGTGSGPEAVMWFEHAYYVERSADRALEVSAPGAALPPAAEIQRGIDSVPPGTAYCVVVAPSGEDRYSVEITEQRPGGAPATYDKQTVTTTVDGGRTLITGIAAG